MRAMAAWLQVDRGDGPRKVALDGGLTLVGGEEGELRVPGSGGDRMHVWDRPPKVLFVGDGERPQVNGAPLEEAALANGDTIHWRGVRFVFGLPEAVLEELPPVAPTPARPAAVPAAAGLGTDVVSRRLRAGMLVELGLADRAVAKRWQDAVVRGEFEPDACAREILAAGDLAPDDPQLVQRSGRLLRDLLMAPRQRGVRGAGLRARRAARTGLAYLISQLVVIAIFSLIVLAALFAVRVRWGWSVDAFLDGIRAMFGGGG